MLRTLVLAAAALALALPAAAATTVTVNVAGLDATAARATITQAAHEACVREFRYESTFDQHYARPICIQAAIAHAEAALDTVKTASSGQVRVVAGR